jgi:uncharacterized phage-associated protein
MFATGPEEVGDFTGTTTIWGVDSEAPQWLSDRISDPTSSVTPHGVCEMNCSTWGASMLRFQFDEKKGVEALAHLASEWPGVTAFFAAKVLYFAEKAHINRYGRPIVADTFIAMPNGPVPSTLYDFIKGQLDNAGDPEAVSAALSVSHGPYPRLAALRSADKEVLSPSDIECLDEAIAFCRARNFKTLSNLTHQERAWREAPANGAMDYEAMIDADNPSRDEIIEEAREFAAYGVL